MPPSDRRARDGLDTRQTSRSRNRDARQTPYDEHREYVLGVLARRCGWLDPSDREALLHDAYAVFLEKLRDGLLNVDEMSAAQVRAYLTQTALNKAMDEGKRVGRRRAVSLDAATLGTEPADPGPGLDERLSSRLHDARVREIVAQLPERQQLIVKLRFFFNRTPQDIQRYLGITERVYRRELERASRQLAERFELVRDGTFCASRRSLLLAYVTGIAGPNRMREARRHLDSCLACAGWILEFQTAARRAAAFVPAPMLAPLLPDRPTDRLVVAAHALHARASELAAAARAHATRAVLRADPSRFAAVSSARPAAVAMMVTGCLAAGSTTYCVVHGLPSPIRSLIRADTRPQHPARLRTTAISPASDLFTRRLVRQSSVISEAKPPPPSHPTEHAQARVSSRPPTARPSAAIHKASPSPSLALASSQAERIYKATAPEFGLGPGQRSSSPTAPSRPVPPPPPPAHRPAPTPVRGGSPPPPVPSKHLPEFDP